MSFVKLVSVAAAPDGYGHMNVWVVDELGRLWRWSPEGRQWNQLQRPQETEPPLKFPKGDEKGGG